jgi:hypothetical protein
MIGEKGIGKHLEGNGRCLSVVLSEPISNANLECYQYANLLGWKMAMNSDILTRKKKFNLNWYGGGVQLGPLDTAVTNGLLCQPRVIMMMEKLEE